MTLGSLVWDASATIIDVLLENAIHLSSVWTAWFQFWGKQYLLHIDVLFFRNILNVQHRIEWVQLDRLKSVNMQRHLVHHIFCANLPDRHLKFECSVLHSNLDFYFKFGKYSKCKFILTALVTCGWPSPASLRKQQANQKRSSWILIRQDILICFQQSSGKKSCKIYWDGFWYLYHRYIFLRTSTPKIKLQKGVQNPLAMNDITISSV